MPFFPTQASTMAGRVDALFFFLVGASLLITLGIAGTILWFAVKYRRRPAGSLHNGLVPGHADRGVPPVLRRVLRHRPRPDGRPGRRAEPGRLRGVAAERVSDLAGRGRPEALPAARLHRLPRGRPGSE